MDYFMNSVPKKGYIDLLFLRFCPACLSKIWVNGCDSNWGGGLNPRNENLQKFVTMRNCPCCNSELAPGVYSFKDFNPSVYIDARLMQTEISMLQNLGAINCGSAIRSKYTWDEILAANPTANLPQVLERRIYPSKICPNDDIRTPDGVIITGFIEPYYKSTYICLYGLDFAELSSFVDKNFEDTVKRKCEERLMQTIAKCKEEATMQPSQRFQLQNIEQLKTFLAHLIDTEKSIYSLTERLKELYNAVYISERTAFRNKHLALESAKRSVMEAEADLQKLRGINPTAHITKNQISFPSIPKPIAPNKPKEPTYETPGFFNKKRVLAANEELRAKYEAEYTAYEEAQKKYEQEIVVYHDKLAWQAKEGERKYEELLKNAKTKHLDKIQKLETLYQKKKDELKSIQDNQSAAPTPETTILGYIQNEIQQAEELLNKLICAKTQMYNSGVIFGKYHSFVAVSSFYEYLCAGRCESLEGTNGAYSLYENEIRINMVISQLSEVIGQLEKIRQNQFVLYSAINEANKQLFSLNHSMTAVTGLLEKANAKLTNIEQNTDVIAYNSAVTAFYSQKNAELTKVLCFLTALN